MVNLSLYVLFYIVVKVEVGIDLFFVLKTRPKITKSNLRGQITFALPCKDRNTIAPFEYLL